ncbi:hypothetical protein NQ314_006995 [Rhamnusium bicolor]|uniref:Uncharacterized protein n=1 Tax=Rhamnusium bicolor TaxID=1586634 RepID=A0AAV8YTY7_9CUCU|nr:hypothetical protein NQ314_006995 [Rhamnusium bicolor]
MYQRYGNTSGMNLKTFCLAVVTGLRGAGSEVVNKGRVSLEQKNTNNYKPIIPTTREKIGSVFTYTILWKLTTVLHREELNGFVILVKSYYACLIKKRILS